MSERVKTRRYESPRRREQAAATRRQILDAAQRLFEERGYAATPMSAVAAEAGVALKTVYVTFETKSGLLRALWHLRLRGDEADTPMGERGFYREMLDEPDPARQVELTAHNSRMVKERAGGLLEVIRNAAPADADSAGLWSRIQADFHHNQRGIVAALHRNGGLRDGLDLDRATDLLWTLNHPDVWHLLVVERGWSPKEWEAWFAGAVRDQIVRPDA
jgi:AcrR family transcriptional regulator